MDDLIKALQTCILRQGKWNPHRYELYQPIANDQSSSTLAVQVDFLGFANWPGVQSNPRKEEHPLPSRKGNERSSASETLKSG